MGSQTLPTAPQPVTPAGTPPPSHNPIALAVTVAAPVAAATVDPFLTAAAVATTSDY